MQRKPQMAHPQSLARPLWRRLLPLVLILSLLAPSLNFTYSGESAMLTPTQSAKAQIILEDEPTTPTQGLQITLSEGVETPDIVEQPPLAPAEPLSDEAIQALLDRVPQMDMPEGDQVEFRLPEEVLPPPRPGTTIDETFPPSGPAVAPVTVADGSLEVLRFAPEGEIPIAPFLSVTFNQPMVPLTTLADLSAADVPVTITPELPGTWKWLGTKTLTFEYSSDEIDRFPKATEYTVEIPAGTQSANGGELAEAVTWTFRTPPPVMARTHPSFGPQPTDPLIFISFDQQIDPDAVLETISVTANREEYAVRLATEEEIAADTTVSNLAKRALDARWLVLRAEEEFPTATTVTVNIGPNTPSAEGPLTTETVQSFSFSTYSPLRIDDHGCGWGDAECPPFSPFFIRFNNQLDTATYTPELVTITPEIPNVVVGLNGTNIDIRGATAGRTTYEVTISGEIQDIFGQTLGEDVSLTFRTGPAQAVLTGPTEPFITLDPSSTAPLYTVYSVNYSQVRVRAFAVTPDEWTTYQEYLREYAYGENPPDPPGRQVLNKTLTIEAVEDELVETNIDLSNALSGETGHLIVVVDVPRGALSSLLSNLPFGRNQEPPRFTTWVQITQIGLDAFVDHSEMVAWATALRDGTPLTDVEVRLFNSNVSASTDDAGVARFALPSQASPVLLATLGDDTALLPQNTYYWGNSGWAQRTVQDELRWYVFDDRQMYRPGEEVHIKGWLRRIGGKQDGDVGLLGDANVSVQYQVTDPQGNQIADGTLDSSELGGFDLAFTLPENVNLGYANIYFNARNVSGVYNTDYYYNFQIQEFRRPEFEVTARNEEKGPFFVGEDAVVAVSAQYFAGGPLPNAETNWNISSSTSSYAPPGWSEFTFGTWVPWWRFPVYSYEMEMGYNGFGGSNYQSYAGRTDASGSHYLRMNFDAASEPRPYSVMAEAVVMDVNRQAWAATTSLLVHPADRYVGLRSDRTFVEKGEPLVIETIVTDLDGNAMANHEVTMTAARLEWQYNNGRWGEEEVDLQECIVTSTTEPVSCEFTTDVGGRYRISASVFDDLERRNESEFTRWVSGGTRPAARDVEQEEVTLIPDKAEYQPGDVAEILVQSPFTPAEGLLTVSRSGILYTERFTIEDGTTTLQIPVADEHIPNLEIQVDLNGAAERTDEQGATIPDLPARPAYARGGLSLAIPPVSRELEVAIAPDANELEPGVETAVAVTVTNAAGEAVADAEVALVVVDEAVLALTNYQLRDPIATFYSQRGSDVSSHYARASIVLANPAELADQVAVAQEQSLNAFSRSAAPMAAGAPAPTMESAAVADMAMDMEESAADDGGDAAAGDGSAITVRSNFDPLAVFAPAVQTDAEGKATVDFTLPDNLTRYRIMVVAVAEGKYFGKDEANLTARLPLMVRPSAPRFLNFGDRFELPIVLQNQTDAEMEVAVAVEMTNLLVDGEQAKSGESDSGQLVTIPANNRVEVRFPATTASAGTARVQIAASTTDFADASMVELPVYTPATTEAFAVYGVVDEGAIAQPVASPPDVFPQFGGLEINTSSTAVQALTDAVLYLTSYPFECSEQLASRILGVAALRDVLTAFEAEGLPTPEEMQDAVQRDIIRLQQLQNWDGGWPIWTRGKESIPYYSIHVAHALQRARMKDFDVPDEMLERSLEHLRNIEDFYPYWYSEQVRHSLSAYALYVRQLMGDVDTNKARNLLNEKPLENQSLEAIAWIWQVIGDDASSAAEVEGIERHLNNRVVETAGAANFTTSYGEDAYLLLHSSRRTDGIILDALIQNQPESDLIPKVVNGLLAHRTAGRWGNTQENAFILLALDRYFNTFEAQTPDFVARIWLGETYAGEHEYVGRTTERHETQIPMRYLTDGELASDETQDLVIEKDGAGRLYYRLGLRYAPTDLDMPPVDMGFVVERSYEAVDDADDVRRDEDGTWRIKAGARVRVRLSMVADNRRYHVALVDPLPAGLEAINPALAVSEEVPADPEERSYGWWWWRTWYDHQNLRDERAEAFATLLWDGVYNYSYVARATTPGEFVVPPAKAEEMYAPEVFGRSATDRVIVE